MIEYINMDIHQYKKMDKKRGVDYIGVSCVFFCHDCKGNLLLHKRSNSCRDEQGKWDCGGGSMEFGESFKDAVSREIKEEYCVEPINLRYVGASNILRKNSGSDTHWIAIIFSAEVDPQKVRIGEPEKIDEIKWFPHNNLPSPVHSMSIEHLEMVKKSSDEFLV